MKSHPILHKVVNAIHKVLATEKIVLLAYIDQNHIPYSVFRDRHFEMKNPIELNLLVVGKSAGQYRAVTIEKIEQKCRHIIPTTILLLSAEQFSHQVAIKSEFSASILGSDQLLYQATDASTAATNESPAASTGIPASDLWYKRAGTFYQTAKAQQRLGEYGMAAFCLHQVAEQLLIFLIQTAVGFKVGSHNLDRLLQHARFYYQDAATVFTIQSGRKGPDKSTEEIIYTLPV
ncbi:hypothetical protein HHL16_16290 [Pseudoflavitalea sp. G-6-1-2]|uniref:hypothetical protein n=1 Tax=Pseudoflavitalea sp. G-6-1-2 TaxID=2728841 RepID=UPI00146C0615|nr:hypothetical protein [Pseudoflavitalea sp. G-6-1-2]NML22445.1 hypothetical protein [Pseudoflavitalea sp. G-6-1-2]